jgi:esterase/lipase superfamily enzyme
VTIPPDHRVGKLESPSIFRLELSEDPEKHLMLQSITCLEDGPFMDKLKERIAASPGQQTFVFIHGYNVAFDDAVRRTAQIAYDLKFRGAPICYSWPSQGGFAQYTRDEANIAWTVVHLDEFLTRVVEQSGAKSIHLVAHSMGNRAIVQVLERMALRRGTAQPLFGQVIMAAPDVDASEFRDRYAPAVAALARHATLYASSHDQALVASTKVHGYTRAGLSGDHLLVTTGVETVDVSPIDTSLIGHSYYGNHPQMIRDMQALVELGTPASGREWLESIVRAPSRAYWMFRRERPRDEL